MPKVEPYGDKILVKRRTIGQKIGSIELPDSIKDKVTDLADVLFVPALTLGDKAIMENAEAIVNKLTDKAKEGDIEAVKSLLTMNDYLMLKMIKKGDKVMIQKYVGIDFYETGETDMLTLVRAEDIIGMVSE